jgi:DNA-binding MarR family transcriptional regulator
MKPTVRRNDPETSHAAAKDASFHASYGRLLALRALYRHGPLTDYDLEKITGWQKNSIGKRRFECGEAGLVKVHVIDGTKQKRPGPSGSMCLIWRLTKKGRDYLRDHYSKFIKWE